MTSPLSRGLRPPALAGRSFSALAVAVLLLVPVSCRRSGVPSEAFRQVSSTLGVPKEDVETVRVYLDVSASMRGFALAATRNEAGASAPFQSLLSGLDSLADEVATQAEPETATAGKPGPGAAVEKKAPPARKEIRRFGAAIEPLAPDVSLVSAPLGRARVNAIGGRQTGPDWLSKDCSTKWGGAADSRLAMDTFFSETITCLNPVFDEAGTEASAKKAYVIVTDAEQLAPEGSGSCPAAHSLGTIQARLDEWIRVKRHFAAVVALRLGYLPWEARATGKRYCGCNEHLLFLYILTPGPETAEKIYALLAGHWKGGPDTISYLPLAPRPASQYDVEVSLPFEDGKKPALFPTNYPKSLQEPRIAHLPVFPIELKGEKALVLVSVKKAGFERSEARSSQGFSRIDWRKAHFAWKEVSSRFTFEKGGKKKPGLVPLEAPGGVEVLLNSDFPKAGEQATHRTGRFQGRATVLPADQADAELPPAAFLLRRAPGKHGSETFLLELTADSTPLVTELWKDTPLIGKAPGPCIRLEALREQVLLAGRTSSVVRFLLHVDY